MNDFKDHQRTSQPAIQLGMRAALLTLFLIAATFRSSSALAATPPTTSAPEVRASSGPVEIVLSLEKTHLAFGDSIRFHVSLKNVGRQKISIHDDVFAYPELMNRRYVHRDGNLFLEVLDSSGKKPWRNPSPPEPSREGYDPALDPEQVPILSFERRKYASKVAEWKKTGVSEVEIDTRLAKDWVERKAVAKSDIPLNELWLEPGASIATIPLASQDHHALGSKVRENDSSQFAEVTSLYMPPGKYKVRAIWDTYFEPVDIAKYHLVSQPWNVRIKTPAIEIEVSR